MTSFSMLAFGIWDAYRSTNRSQGHIFAAYVWRLWAAMSRREAKWVWPRCQSVNYSSSRQSKLGRSWNIGSTHHLEGASGPKDLIANADEENFVYLINFLEVHLSCEIDSWYCNLISFLWIGLSSTL